jgi:hypothetical protein
MIDLTNANFGDKYKTRDGRVVVLTKKRRHPRHGIWFEGWYGSVDCDFADCNPNCHWWNKDGTAQEDFKWLDLIEKFK